MEESIKKEKDEEFTNNSRENIDVKLENKFIQEINNLKFINKKNNDNIHIAINSIVENKDQTKNQEIKSLNRQNKGMFEHKFLIIFYSIVGCCLLLHWFHFIFSEYVRYKNNI